MQVHQIVKIIEKKYPRTLAYDYDNVGLQIGSSNKKVKKILISLDLTRKVVDEAINLDVDMIICHHPLIFKPVYQINFDSYRGRIIEKLITNDIVLYVAHTNFDLANGGMNDCFSEILNLKNAQILDMETENEGIGRIGDITPCNMSEYINSVKKTLNLDSVRFTGNINKIVKRVAISGGSGQSHIGIAKMKGADLYLTGDVSYHTAHDALNLGLNVLDIGHHAEKVFMPCFKEFLETEGVDTEILISEVNTDPYIYI